jgi:DNA-binding XRE family transcriptional regulator
LGHRLRMTAELRDWLAELGESQPATAAEVGAALVAVLQSAELSSLGILSQPGPAAAPVSDDPRATVDDAYRQQLENLQPLRRRVADAATRRRGVEVRISAQRAAGADAAVLDGLAEQLAAAHAGEAALARVSKRIQLEVEAFRTAKETAKARYTAAEASLRIAEAVEAAGGQPDPDLAQRRADYRAAEEGLRALRAWAAETVGVMRMASDQAGPGFQPAGGPKPPPPTTESQPPPTAESPPQPATESPLPYPLQGRDEPVPGLLELLADPLGSDIRILLAEHPADTVTLLAVLEGPEAVSQHGARAIRLAGDLLTEIRAEGWPADIDEVEIADPAEFIAQFFPADDADSMARRAGVLAAMTPLGKLRASRALTIEQVAERSGLSAHRVAAIERDGLRAARVYEAVALARALGARLELTPGSGPVTG